jgi:hypothetical protein
MRMLMMLALSLSSFLVPLALRAMEPLPRERIDEPWGKPKQWPPGLQDKLQTQILAVQGLGQQDVTELQKALAKLKQKYVHEDAVALIRKLNEKPGLPEDEKVCTTKKRGAHTVKKERPKAQEEDIAVDYNPAKACVLQAAFLVSGGPILGASNAQGLHELIWKQEQYKEYRQYSDDAVSDKLYAFIHLPKYELKAGTTAGQLEQALPAGTYVVSVKGTVEDHVMVLVISGKSGKTSAVWKDYDQLGGQGFKTASPNKAALVTSVHQHG